MRGIATTADGAVLTLDVRTGMVLHTLVPKSTSPPLCVHFLASDGRPLYDDEGDGAHEAAEAEAGAASVLVRLWVKLMMDCEQS